MPEKILLSPKEGDDPWNTLLSDESTLERIQVSDLTQLKIFLENFNLHAEPAGFMPVEFDQQLLTDIADDLNQKLSQTTNLGSEMENTLKIEPLFISALKILLDMKAD